MGIVSPADTASGLSGNAVPSAYPVLAGADGANGANGAEHLVGAVGTALRDRWSSDPTLLGKMCHYALVPTGKLFRPLLLLEAALAVGGKLGEVLPAAVGAECGHVASLIHDDIIDHDDLRRGRASVQYAYGIGDAIVAGDALIFDLFASLADCQVSGVPADRVVAALDAVARAGLDLCRGQTLESELSRNLRFDADAYLEVARLKTAAYFRAACQSGALLGGGDSDLVDALSAYGNSLGLAFQIHDDLLGYVSHADNTGKSDTSDIENARMTLPVILAHDMLPPEGRRRLRATMTGELEPSRAHQVVLELLEQTGAIAAASAIARRYAQESSAALVPLPDCPSRARLRWIAELVIARDH